MVCQSLQAVAAFLSSTGTRARPIATSSGPGSSTSGQAGADRGVGSTRPRGWGAGTPAAPASTARSRWSTPTPPGAISPGRRSEGTDELAPYRDATPDLLTGFQARRLEAMEHVAKDFRGNKQTREDAVRSARPGGVRGEGPHPGPRPARVRHHRAARRRSRPGSGSASRRRSSGCSPGRRCSSATGGGPGAGRRRAEPGERAPQTPQRGPARRLPRGTPGRQADQALQGRDERSRTGRRRGCGSGCAWRAPTSPATSTRSWASPRSSRATGW